jgi:hypothetical protein
VRAGGAGLTMFQRVSRFGLLMGWMQEEKWRETAEKWRETAHYIERLCFCFFFVFLFFLFFCADSCYVTGSTFLFNVFSFSGLLDTQASSGKEGRR